MDNKKIAAELVRIARSITTAAVEPPPFPMTVGDWQIYEMAGASRAAAALASALKRAVKKIEPILAKAKEYESEHDPMRRRASGAVLTALYEADKAVGKVQDKYSNFGATDTEPNAVVRHFLAAYAAYQIGSGEVEANAAAVRNLYHDIVGRL